MVKHVLPGFLTAVLLCSANVQAHTPVEFLEVIQGEPSNLIEHGVELKSVFDEQKVMTDLEGPYHFSLAVGCLGRGVKQPKAYMSWYKIANISETQPRKLAVVDLIGGAQRTPISIGSAEFLLSPAQRITTGPPSQIPDGLDLYKAYRILDAPQRQLEVELAESKGPSKRVAGRPLFLCVATEEWHHDEYFPASHPKDCFVVYELDSQEHSERISLIDQFGLNQIDASKSQWLVARGFLSTVREDR